MEIVYIRGSQIRFVIVPDMLQKAPFFNRIKLWRKFKGHAIFGQGLLKAQSQELQHGRGPPMPGRRFEHGGRGQPPFGGTPAPPAGYYGPR